MVVSPDKREDLVETVIGLIEPTRVEKGCLDYHFFKDIEDENSFTILERWATQEDIEKFVRSDSYHQLLTAMELLAKPPDIKINAVSYTAGLEAIKAARNCSD